MQGGLASAEGAEAIMGMRWKEVNLVGVGESERDCL